MLNAGPPGHDPDRRLLRASPGHEAPGGRRNDFPHPATPPAVGGLGDASTEPFPSGSQQPVKLIRSIKQNENCLLFHKRACLSRLNPPNISPWPVWQEVKQASLGDQTLASRICD